MYVAFASHGRRLELCGENLKSLMYPKQTMEAERYILTIYKDDVNRLLKNKRLMKYVEDNGIGPCKCMIIYRFIPLMTTVCI